MLWVTRSHVHVDRVACPWLIACQFEVYDSLYAWCRLAVAKGNPAG